MKNGSLVLAMSNPVDLIAISDVETVTGMMVKPVLATRSSIQQAVRHTRLF